MASVLLVGGVLVHFLKHYFGRPRPLDLFDGNINVIYEKLYSNSFPSGHTELAFSLCTFMLIMVKKYWYLYIIFAFTSGFYRIYTGSHFPSDVFVGALIGIFSAYVVVCLFRKHLKIY
jgi:membrane-associated phospholipid phosphatase